MFSKFKIEQVSLLEFNIAIILSLEKKQTNIIHRFCVEKIKKYVTKLKKLCL